MAELVRYRNMVFDSGRWAEFSFRPDDIVISTPPKSGTTWMQMLCAMLVFDAVEFDRPLAEISPWLDMQTNDLAAIVAVLDSQQHRRFIKTHTPLDGVPENDEVTYICVGRDPRDVAFSFQHHWCNLDLDAFLAARSAAVGLDDLAGIVIPDPPSDDSVEQFRRWVDASAGAAFIGPTLADVLHHLQTFWVRRQHLRVVLFHYNDLQTDLPGQLRRLSDALGVDISDDRIRELAAAATFDNMKQRADQLVPDVGNKIWRDNRDFFHRGVAGQWRDLLQEADGHRYERRVAELVPAELSRWAHVGWLGM